MSKDQSTQARPDAALTDEQFRRFASGLSHVIWRLSADGTRIIAPRWAELTGKPESELQSNRWLDTIHPDDRSAVHAALRGAVVYGSHFQATYRLRLRGGSYHWFHGRGEPTRGVRNEVTGWIGVSSNIDDQKRAETALVENDARLRMVIDAARVGTIDHDLVTGEIHSSPLALRLIGLPEHASTTFDRVRECVHPDDREAFAHAVERATAPDSNGEMEVVFRARHADGTCVWLNTRGTYVFEGTGKERRATRFVGVAGDLTGHMRSLAQRAMLSAIVSSSNDAIVATTLDGIVTHWNAAAERIYGYRSEQILGQSILRLVPPEDAQRCRASLEAVARGETVANRITDRIKSNGQRITVSSTLSLIRDDLGRAVGISSIISDMTEHRRLEQEVAQSQKLEAVGQLAGGVAHDLNNILTAILAGVEFAANSPNLDAETRTEFGEVRSDCLRAAGLVRQLLAVAKRQVIDPRPCDVNATIADLTPLLVRMLGDDVALSTSLNATCGIFADASQLRQVILNLAANSRDAMPKGGRFTIETRNDEATHTLQILVGDTGTGMSPEAKAHLFEPFFTTKGVGNGTGLGLSTSYGIIAQSGGTMSIASEAGLGTTVTISLPIADDVEIAPSASTNAPRSTGRETVLVVEDDASVRNQVVRYLVQLGYNVVEARNGAEAMIAMERHSTPPNLLLTDVVMPIMCGAELADHLRAEYPALRVLFMSGYSARAVETYGVVVAYTELLQKPFELPALAARIRRILDAPRQTPVSVAAVAA